MHRSLLLISTTKGREEEKKITEITFKKVEILWFEQSRLGGEDSHGLSQGFLARFRRQDGCLLRLRAQAPLQGS
jgi:hypothetical protein